MTVDTPAALAVAIAHVRRGNMRVASGGHVAPGDVDRDQPLAGDESRRDLGRELVHRVALREREVPHLRSREVDVALDAGGDVVCSPLDLVRAHDDLTVPLVELPCVLTDDRFAIACDGGQHLIDDLARLARFRRWLF